MLDLFFRKTLELMAEENAPDVETCKKMHKKIFENIIEEE